MDVNHSLQEAVINGNRQACLSLLRQGAQPQKKNEKGWNAFQLASFYQPRLLDLFFFPHSSVLISPKQWIFFEENFPPFINRQECFYRRYTDDFGLEINQLLMCKNLDHILDLSEHNPSKIEATIANMKFVCKKLGIELKMTYAPYHVRDFWMWTSKGELLCQNESFCGYLQNERPHLLNQAIEKVIDYSLINHLSGFSRSKNHFLQTVPGNFIKNLHFLDKDEKKFFGKFKKSPLAFLAEGGNVLKLTNHQAELKILIGEFQFFTTLNAYILEETILKNAFKSSFAQSLIEKIAHELTTETMDNLLEEMLAQGIFHLDKSQKSLPNQRQVMAEYCWQKTFVKGLIGANFNVKDKDVILIPQVFYHLDYFIKSGPYHHLLVGDPEKSVHLLECILQNSSRLALTDRDIHIAENYLKTLKQLHQELHPLLLLTKERLQQAGFTVVFTPGIFIGEKEETWNTPLNFNYLNALSGWSSKTRKFYYLTTGNQVGDKLGLILMDFFDEFLKRLEPDLEVYFLGRNPHDLNDLTEPMTWWNTQLAQFGLHCLTFELATKNSKAH